MAESNENNNQFGPVRLVCQGPAKPDLVVRDIRLVQGCKMQVTIANIGKAGVPASGYDPGHGVALQMAKGNKPWGGIRLSVVDPAKKLAKPGGAVTFLWFPDASNLALSQGPNYMMLTIDANNAVSESNEGNNVFKKMLYCSGPLNPNGHGFPLKKLPVKPNTVMPNDKVKGGPAVQPRPY